MKRILFITLLIIASFAMTTISITLAQTRSPRANSAEDFFNRGVTRYQRGDPEGAMRDFDRAIDLATSLSPGSYAADQIGVNAPEPAVIHYNRGVTRYDLHDWDGAIADLDVALMLKPLYLMAWIKRGNTRMNKGDWEEAIYDYNQALQLDPRSVIAWNNRGVLYFFRRSIRWI